MINTENLTILHEGETIIEDIYFHIKPGECVALMGLNGSGKSTLLKTILNLHTSYEGQIFLAGLSTSDPSSRKDLIYLPEKFKVNGAVTGENYLKFVDCAKEDIIRKIGFPTKALKQKVQTYSKGMLQKLGLIYFFGQTKRLKIADEIMSGLDYKTREAVRDLLTTQHRDGTTFLFTTHTFEDAQETNAHIYLLEDKKILFGREEKNLKALI